MKTYISALTLLSISMVSPSVLAISNSQVFAFAEANYSSLFNGAGSEGTYLQYSYRYYPATGNYLAVDGSGGIYALGEFTDNQILYVGPVADYTPAITSWEASQSGSTSTSTGNGSLNGASNLAVSTIAGTGAVGSSDGIGSSASFNQPYGLVKVGANIYVTDSLNNTIRKIDTITGAVTTFAGQQSALGGTADGIGSAASFYTPSGITSDGTSLYVTDMYAGTIRKIDIATARVTTLTGAVKGAFTYASNITTDGTNLYVTDAGRFTVSQISLATGALTILAGTSGTHGTADGTGTAATFSYPLGGITTDGTNLYVTDVNRIRKIVIATGVVTTLAGSIGAGGTDGTGIAATFSSAVGITNDGTYLYVADMYNQAIRKIEIASGVVTTLSGLLGTSGNVDGTGGVVRFFNPSGVILDGATMYVADSGNNTIRKMQ